MAADRPSEFFTADHRDCDRSWTELEGAVDGRANDAVAKWKDFDARMRRHFEMEEEVLFPAIEEATGMVAGPTEVMRIEHRQMRAVLDQMRAAADAGDYEAILDHGDALLMLIQQHNVKEEGILYPLADRVLADRWPELRARLES